MLAMEIDVLLLQQQRAEGTMTHPQQGSMASSSHLYRPMSGDAETMTSLTPGTYLNDSFSNNLAAPANPNALRRQSLSFEEALNQPKREGRRPPISAFQSAASQDCKP